MSTDKRNELLAQYVEAAEAHGQAIERGDFKMANRNHRIATSAYAQLQADGPTSQLDMLPLLRHPSASVRAWVAAHALDFAPEQGKAVLAELVRDGGLIGLIAEIALKEWERRDGSP
jgi:hypothetical protein